MKNPYITDRPLTQGDLYFGRERHFARLVEDLGAGRRLFLLYGQTLSGKTSFVNRLGLFFEERLETQRLDLGPLAEEYSRPAWMLLAGMARTLGQPEPERDALDSPDAPEYVAWYLRGLAASQSRDRLVSFDAMDASDLVPGSEWEHDLLLLYDALPESGRLAFLVVVEGLPDASNNPALETISRIVLGPLAEHETADVLMVPVRGVLAYDIDVIANIQAFSGGMPWFVQLFGEAIFDRRIGSGWVGKSEAEDVLPVVLERAAPYFQHLWRTSTPEEKVTLSAVAELWGFGGVASAVDVATYMRKLQVRVPAEDIERAFALLTARGLMRRLGGETYRLVQQLFGHWVKENTTVMGTVQETRRYRKIRPPRRSPWAGRRPDWAGMALWSIAALLVFAIAYVWQSRQRSETWGLGGRAVSEEERLGPGRGPTPVLPPPSDGTLSGHVVYQSRPDESSPWDIYIMRADGSEQTRLTDTPSNETLPALSPDGQRIAFVSDRDGNREIYVMNVDGSEQTNLTRDAADDWTPSWSPDGQYIVFSSFRDGNWEVYRMAADGSEQRRITHNEHADYSPAWSPDGSTIAFVTDRDGDLEIYLMDPEGGDQRNLTSHPATDQGPSWSPDGQWIMWESYRDDNMELYVCDPEGGNLNNMSRDAYADDRGGSWSPWGEALVYHTNVETGWEIFVLDLQAGRKSNLTQSPAQEQYPHWGP